jgi:hypothetical protein
LQPVEEELLDIGGKDVNKVTVKSEELPTRSGGKSHSLLRPVPVLVPRFYQHGSGSISCEGKEALLRILNDATSDKENRFVVSY